MAWRQKLTEICKSSTWLGASSRACYTNHWNETWLGWMPFQTLMEGMIWPKRGRFKTELLTLCFVLIHGFNCCVSATHTLRLSASNFQGTVCAFEPATSGASSGAARASCQTTWYWPDCMLKFPVSKKNDGRNCHLESYAAVLLEMLQEGSITGSAFSHRTVSSALQVSQ